MLEEFRSINRILAQSPEALARVLGHDRTIANILLGARDMFLEGLQADLAAQPVDPACPKLNQYLMASMGSLPDEVLRILFLDASYRLIADETLHRGSVRQLELYPRTIFRRAMEHGATGLILVHNHPSGDPKPSQSDIDATRRLVSLGLSLDVEIVDHIVVTATSARRIGALGPRTGDRPDEPAHVLRDSINRGDPSGKHSIALENARRAYARRKFRRSLFGASKLFNEPAWDILIDIFVHECEGKKVPISALCHASYAPVTTALRRVNDLCEAGHAVRIDDPDDGRRHFVALVPRTSQLLNDYFGVTDDWPGDD